jgi:hypothetical protein
MAFGDHISSGAWHLNPCGQHAADANQNASIASAAGRGADQESKRTVAARRGAAPWHIRDWRGCRTLASEFSVMTNNRQVAEFEARVILRRVADF